MGVLLALASAVAYGTADFAGGLLSRRAHFGTIALVGQLAGLGFATVVALLVPATPDLGDLGWGALSGAGTGVGAAACGATATAALVCYLLATRQALDVVAVVLSSLYPAIPVLLGITVLRERLSTWQIVGLAGAGTAIGLLAVG